MKLKIQNASDTDLISAVRNKLNYCQDTGVFTRLTRMASNAKKGDVAGSLHRATGYIHITINSKKYLAHRLAWLYTYGELPELGIDHINRNKSDNRISNLRIATSAENQQNRQKNKNNTSGHQGIYWDAKTSKWAAQIMKKRKCIYIGRFVNIEDAVSARNYAKANFHKFHSGVTI